MHVMIVFSSHHHGFSSHWDDLFQFSLLTLFIFLPRAIRNYVARRHYRRLLYWPRLIDVVVEDG